MAFACHPSPSERRLGNITVFFMRHSLLDLRVRIGKAPMEWEVSKTTKCGLEISMRAYITKRDGNVVIPVIGTSSDSIDKAYNFYNLYSLEFGFGVKLLKSRLNVAIGLCAANLLIHLSQIRLLL